MFYPEKAKSKTITEKKEMKKNKTDKFLDAVYGNKIKGRWLKILGSIALLFFMLSSFLFILFNVGCNDKGLYIKPTDIKIDINVGSKK